MRQILLQVSVFLFHTFILINIIYWHIYGVYPVCISTGSDTTASFFIKGKKRLGIYGVYSQLLHFFNMLSSPITDEMELGSCKKVLHEFVNRLYGLGSVGQSVDDARLQAIVFGGRDFNNIPPSSDALHQNVMCTSYQ